MNVQCEKAGVVKNHFQVIHLGIWVGGMVIYKFMENKIVEEKTMSYILYS